MAPYWGLWLQQRSTRERPDGTEYEELSAST